MLIRKKRATKEINKKVDEKYSMQFSIYLNNNIEPKNSTPTTIMIKRDNKNREKAVYAYCLY